MSESPRTTLDLQISATYDRLKVLSDFELKHRDFLNKSEAGYFLNDTDGAVVFLYDQMGEVKSYFGAEGWRLAAHTGAVERTVDGVVVRLILPHDNGFASQEISL